tara:strand:- start:39 stop:335 length:297 start_codon:yes stop_codon:yes gene_type:complete
MSWKKDIEKIRSLSTEQIEDKIDHLLKNVVKYRTVLKERREEESGQLELTMEVSTPEMTASQTGHPTTHPIITKSALKNQHFSFDDGWETMQEDDGEY